MTGVGSIPLPPFVESFFMERLINRLGASRHTVRSYRDTVLLLLAFAEDRLGKDRLDMDVREIDVELVGDFLDHLESGRGNKAQSRNVRLAAIRSLFRHVASKEPLVMRQCQRIVDLPNKRHERGSVCWLTAEETEALVDAPDLDTWYGRRDRALLMLAVQTGLRVSELTGLGIGDVDLGRGPHVRCLGKGRKERATPLRAADTVKVLRDWIEERGDDDARAPLFPSNRGRALSRDAVERIVKKHSRTAAAACPSIGDKNVSPHVLRHSSAMAMLHEDIDSTIIALILGHESVETTQAYVHADPRLKERALEKTRPVGVTPGRYRPGNSLTALLKSL